MAGAGERQALENGRRWSMVVAGERQVLENGRRWRMVVAGEWEALENGSRWRMVAAGEWQALENGRCWRRKEAGEFRAPAPFSSPFSARRDQNGRDLNVVAGEVKGLEKKMGVALKRIQELYRHIIT